jgi:hypothetical protein
MGDVKPKRDTRQRTGATDCYTKNGLESKTTGEQADPLFRFAAGHLLKAAQAAYQEFLMPLHPAIPHSDLTYRIIGCAMRVHTRLGPGLKEHHYQKAMTAEMLADSLRVSEEHNFEVYAAEEWIGCDRLATACPPLCVATSSGWPIARTV